MSLSSGEKSQLFVNLTTGWQTQDPGPWLDHKIREKHITPKPNDPPKIQSLFEKINNDSDLEVPSQNGNGKFFHSTTLNYDDFKRRIGARREQEFRTKDEVLAQIALVVALELNVEPHLRFHESTALDSATEAGVSSSLKRKWGVLDRTGNYYIAKPNNFKLKEADGSYVLTTTSSGKNTITNNAHVLWSALQNMRAPMDMVQFHTLTPAGCVNLMEGGYTAKGVTNTEWVHVFIRDGQANSLTRQAKIILGQNFGLENHQFAACDLGGGLNVIAVDCEALIKAKRALMASLQVQHAIINGLPAGQSAETFLEEKLLEGADPKYLGLRANKNPSFIDMMRQYGRQDLINALFALQASNEMPIEATRPTYQN